MSIVIGLFFVLYFAVAAEWRKRKLLDPMLDNGDQFVTNQNFIKQRRAIAETLPTTHGYGTCRCCQLPWYVVEGKEIEYTPQRSMFAICRMCFHDLPGAEEIVEYYKSVWDSWPAESTKGLSFDTLENNILTEKPFRSVPADR